jgi:cytosine/adenosine deaminase-related metal-dependent hydrolase
MAGWLGPARDVRLLTASWVVPVGAPPIPNGRVAVAGGRVAWVGGEHGAPEGPVTDLGPGVLLPGLVNAHCHLELSHLWRRETAGGFVSWVARIVAARGKEDGGASRAAADGAVRALEGNGTVAVGDVSNALGHLDLLAGSSLAAVVFHELIAWDPAAAESALAQATARVAAARERLTNSRVDVRLAAHAPHSVSPQLLTRMVAEGGPAAIHLAESPAESAFLENGTGEWPGFLAARGLGHVDFTPPGLSPVAYAETRGVLHPGLVAAHCVQTGAADHALLARRGVSVALCPRSNAALGVGLAPVPGMLEAGVRLCVGTDSLASAPSLDLVDDLVALHRAFPGIDAGQWVRMATLGGAEALGLGDLGVIAPGRRAALAFARAEQVPSDPCGFLVSGEARLAPVRVA